MSLRFCCCALLALGLAIQSGCCCFTPFAEPLLGPPWPCGRTYYGSQCGCKYWHWWFSHKPNCCEPCCCGEYSGSANPYVVSGPPYTKFGPLYSDGSGSNQPGAIGELYPGPNEPTPAGQPPEGLMDEASPMNDIPPAQMEELPGPTTSVPRDGIQRMAGWYGPVDSPRGSRTLGRRPRTRLFSF